MRTRLFEIIETAKENDTLSNIYDMFMIAVIVASLIPLAFKEEYPVFFWIDKAAVTVFIIDYLLRLATADLKVKKGVLSFFIYPFLPMAVLDLLCILPSLNILDHGFRLLKIFRLIRTLRVFRVFKAVRYSKSLHIIKNVFQKQKKPLMTVGMLAAAYILVSALVILNVEPSSFDNFFDAIYWATVSLTTVGYGDIYPVSTIGRIVTMLSAVFGIAIIALPSGIITAGFMRELTDRPKDGPDDGTEDPKSEEN